MNKKQKSYGLLALVTLTVINGCATTETNVARFDDEFYRQSIIKSANNQQLKEYSTKNNIKFTDTYWNFNAPSGALHAVVIDGKTTSWISDTTTKFLNESTANLVKSGLGGINVAETGRDIYSLRFCGDFTHANIGENASSGAMEYSYSVSSMSNDELQAAIKGTSIVDCESAVPFSGNVIYKKKIQVSSNASNAKISPIMVNKSLPITNKENLSLILKDMIGQAVLAILTDKEMIQALKDYRLTESKAPQPPKVAMSEPSAQNQAVNLDNFKAKCKDLGFKEGSKDYGNCVLQLME